MSDSADHKEYNGQFNSGVTNQVHTLDDNKRQLLLWMENQHLKKDLQILKEELAKYQSLTKVQHQQQVEDSQESQKSLQSLSSHVRQGSDNAIQQQLFSKKTAVPFQPPCISVSSQSQPLRSGIETLLSNIRPSSGNGVILNHHNTATTNKKRKKKKNTKRHLSHDDKLSDNDSTTSSVRHIASEEEPETDPHLHASAVGLKHRYTTTKNGQHQQLQQHPYNIPPLESEVKDVNYNHNMMVASANNYFQSSSSEDNIELGLRIRPTLSPSSSTHGPQNPHFHSTIYKENKYSLISEEDKGCESTQLLIASNTGSHLQLTKLNSNSPSASKPLKETDNFGHHHPTHQFCFWKTVQDRAAWLVGLLILQSMSSFIISRNEKLLQQHLVIVQFLTMLVGAGGNAGNQASVNVIRGIAIGIVTEKNAKQYLYEESKMAFTLSFLLGIVGCIRAAVFLTPFRETIAITASLICIVLISVLLGALLPMIMKLCHIDPAHSSTTIQVFMDILGVLITVNVSSIVLDSPLMSLWFE